MLYEKENNNSIINSNNTDNSYYFYKLSFIMEREMKFSKKSKLFIVCFGIFVIISIYIVNLYDIFVIDGDSMAPTLKDGDVVIIKRTKEIQDSDIVVIETEGVYSDIGYKYIIKRYNESKSNKGMYVVGDNEKNSIDSRDFGEIPYYMLEGKVICKIPK